MKNSNLLQLKIKSILLEENPGGVYIKELHNKDEYNVEIPKIVEALKASLPEKEFVNRINALFLNDFGKTGKESKYKVIAKRIWGIYKNV